MSNRFFNSHAICYHCSALWERAASWSAVLICAGLGLALLGWPRTASVCLALAGVSAGVAIGASLLARRFR